MPKVLVLADHIASQIAAGEVVERPSSVVKELIENALDSGATQIEISISADCRDIRIADNGCGMEIEDAVLAFHRHATSKLKNVEDLWNLHSLGFRGEALPSIASVARVTCLTRTHESTEGSKVEAADGKVTTSKTGCAPGTVMEIQDLFYNVPARLSFLKRASTEFGHIHEIVQSLAIAYPHVAINLLHQGTSSFRTTGSGDLSITAKEAGLFSGREQLCEVKAGDRDLGLSVHGFIAKPLHFRGDRKGILSIVNNRPVRCPLTYKALDYAYSDLIPRGRHPFAVVVVNVNPSNLDVNIHPTKKEIKYSNGNAVYIAIQRALMAALRQAKSEAREAEVAREREAFHHQVNLEMQSHSTAFGGENTVVNNDDLVAPATLYSTTAATRNNLADNVSALLDEVKEGHSIAESIGARATRQLGFKDRLQYATRLYEPVNGTDNSTSGGIGDSASDLVGHMHSSGSLSADDDGSNLSVHELPPQPTYTLPHGWTIAAYIHNTYIILETPEGMEIVEQHIAHERTLYERLLAQQTVAGRTTECAQRLLVSTPLNLSAEQTQTLKGSIEVLRKLGFDFDVSGEEVTCTQVPLELAHKDYACVVQEIVQQIAIADGADLELEATKSIACQSAIKNGMPMSERDLVQLLREWDATPRNDTCPHGRPVRLKFSMEKLFQMFHPA
jgi:DNA mismatch repair protein MutL